MTPSSKLEIQPNNKMGSTQPKKLGWIQPNPPPTLNQTHGTTFGSSPSPTRAVAVQRPTEARRVTLRVRTVLGHAFLASHHLALGRPNPRSAEGTAWPPNRTGRWAFVSSSVACWSAAPPIKCRQDPRRPCSQKETRAYRKGTHSVREK